MTVGKLSSLLAKSKSQNRTFPEFAHNSFTSLNTADFCCIWVKIQKIFSMQYPVISSSNLIMYIWSIPCYEKSYAKYRYKYINILQYSGDHKKSKSYQ